MFPKSFLFSIAISICLVSIAAGLDTPHKASTSERNVNMGQASGLLFVTFPSGSFRGSATIARSNVLLYSCAHVLYENGWADPQDVEFFPGYHGSGQPADPGTSPRGFYYFSTYRGGESLTSFSRDITVAYATGTFGNAVPVFAKNSEGKVSSRATLKRIYGYPAESDFNGKDGGYFMHVTGSFKTPLFKERGDYWGVDEVSTGPGNSGGGVFVKSGGRFALAGVLVSGSRRSAGIRILGKTTDYMSRSALAAQADRSLRRFSDRRAVKLRDGTKKFTIRRVNVSGFTSNIHALHITTKFKTTYRADLDVYLKSPSGRIKYIAKDSGGSRDDLDLTSKALTATFRGIDPNGTWRLYMRDDRKLDRSTYQFFTLEVDA